MSNQFSRQFTINGVSEDALQDAINQVAASMNKGCVAGQDFNEEGGYFFDSKDTSHAEQPLENPAVSIAIVFGESATRHLEEGQISQDVVDGFFDTVFSTPDEVNAYLQGVKDCAGYESYSVPDQNQLALIKAKLSLDASALEPINCNLAASCSFVDSGYRISNTHDDAVWELRIQTDEDGFVSLSLGCVKFSNDGSVSDNYIMAETYMTTLKELNLDYRNDVEIEFDFADKPVKFSSVRVEIPNE